MVSGAPLLFLAAVAAGVGILWWLFGRRRVALLRAEVELLDQQLKYTDQLIADLRPQATAYSKLLNGSLRERAVRVAVGIYNLFEQASSERMYASKRRGEEASQEPEPSLVAMQEADTASILRRAQSRYDLEFRSDALGLSREILDRLSTLPSGAAAGRGGGYTLADLSLYEGPLGYISQLQVIAQNLDALARQLPLE